MEPNNNGDEHDRDYEIGYGKPPKHSRWKPGESGNPKGRPKKTKDVEKLLAQELDMTIRITENGQSKTITKREALVKTLVNDALQRNKQSLKIVLGVMQNSAEIEGFTPDPEDQRAFENFVSRLGSSGGGESEGSESDGGESND